MLLLFSFSAVVSGAPIFGRCFFQKRTRRQAPEQQSLCACGTVNFAVQWTAAADQLGTVSAGAHASRSSAAASVCPDERRVRPLLPLLVYTKSSLLSVHVSGHSDEMPARSLDRWLAGHGSSSSSRPPASGRAEDVWPLTLRGQQQLGGVSILIEQQPTARGTSLHRWQPNSCSTGWLTHSRNGGTSSSACSDFHLWLSLWS